MSQTKGNKESEIQLKKEHLRLIVKERLQRISNTDRLEKSQRLQSLIAQFMKKQTGSGAHFWGAFMPLKDEIQVRWHELAHKKFVYPKILDTQMVFAEPGKMTPGPFGLLQPVGAEVAQSGIQGYFIPGLAFNQRGERLGRGKGFYDRYLVNAVGIKVGVGFEDQIFEFIPVDSHDAQMDFIITEQQVIKVGDRKWKL